jgi:CDP-diacylglycerol--glycerol-3-phosphate 3-phosphatidyltransferase
VLTVAALIWCLVDAAVRAIPGSPDALLTLASFWPFVLGLALLWTVGSGVEYFWKAMPLLRR